jgi:hypothetical protein
MPSLLICMSVLQGVLNSAQNVKIAGILILVVHLGDDGLHGEDRASREQ